jgi:hypothetical protein
LVAILDSGGLFKTKEDSMIRPFTSAAAAGVIAMLGLGAAVAQGGPTLVADLSSDAENPPAGPLLTSTGEPRPASAGTAVFQFNDDLTAMTFTAVIQNIDFTGAQTPADPNDDLVAAHIHAGPDVTRLTNGPVVWGFFGSPFNETSPNDQVVTPLATGVGGTISGKWDLPEGNNTTLDAQLSNLLEGHAYINFHTTQFPGGEVRGQIVPLPPTALTGLLGLAMVCARPMWTAFRHSRPRAS